MGITGSRLVKGTMAIAICLLLILIGQTVPMTAMQKMFQFSAYAQQTNDFSNYFSPDYGISIDYPNDWYKEEYTASNYVVSFYSPYEGATDDYAEYVGIFVETASKGTILDAYVDAYVDELKQTYPELELIQTTSSSTTSIDGQPAIRIVTTDTDFDEDGKNDQKSLRVFTLIDGRFYVIIYDAVQGRYQDYLATVELMIDSVEIDSSKLAQPTLGGEFLTYHNSTYGVQMDYPDNWLAEPAVEEFSIVTFYSPYENDVDALADYMFIAYEIVIPGTSLADYTDSITKMVKQTEGDNLDIIDSRQTTIAGLPGHRLTYTSFLVGIGETKITAIWTINDGRAYLFYFGALKSTYDGYISTAEKMFDSVKLTDGGSGPSSTVSPPIPDLTTKEYLTYDNTAYAYSLEYPDSWLKIESNDVEVSQSSGPGSVAFSAPTRDALVSITVDYLPEIGMTLDEYTDYSLESLKKAVSLFNLLESDTSSATVSGHPAHKVSYTGLISLLDDRLISVKVSQVWSIIGSQAFIVTYMAIPERFDDYLEVSERAASSFTVDETALPKVVSGKYTNGDLGLELNLTEKWHAIETNNNDVSIESMKTSIVVLPIVSRNNTTIREETNSSATQPLASFMAIGTVGKDDILSGRYDQELKQNPNLASDDCTLATLEIDSINDMKTLKAFMECRVTSPVEQGANVTYDTLAYAFVTSEKIIYVILNSHHSDASPAGGKVDATEFSEFDELLATLKIHDTLDLSDPNAYVILEQDAHTQKVSMQTVSVGDNPYHLPVISNSTITNLSLDEEKKQISFTVEGEVGTKGTTSIEVNKVLRGPFVVMVDGNAIPDDDLFLIEDKTSEGMILSISYPHSSHEVTISGATVVPEFGSIAVYAMAIGIIVLMVWFRMPKSRFGSLGPKY